MKTICFQKYLCVSPHCDDIEHLRGMLNNCLEDTKRELSDTVSSMGSGAEIVFDSVEYIDIPPDYTAMHPENHNMRIGWKLKCLATPDVYDRFSSTNQQIDS